MRQIVTSSRAPPAIGAYSQAIESGNLLFTSGQIAMDPETGKLVEGGIVTQTERVLDNLQAVLEAAGLSFDHVVKTTIYLIDLADFATVNELYAKRFSHEPSARSTVQVAALPRGARLLMDMVATTQFI